tara:strand:- start:27475 stop:27930 length:456 start_codon:yes stop_codon:yes gene_type:complete
MTETVRPAAAKDLKNCVALALDMISEGYYKDYDVNEGDMLTHALLTYHEPDWLFMVYEKEGKVVGFFSAQITKTFFGSDLVAEQKLMYIDPSHRGGIKAPMAFMRGFRDWAAANKCKGAFFAPTVSVRTGFDAIAKRLGYDFVGPMYGIKP